MRLGRGLNDSLARPYPLGYTALPTDGLNTEKARFSVGSVMDSGLWITPEVAPSAIELHVRLTPVWINNKTACGQLGDAVPCSLYPFQAAFSTVQIEAVGTGAYQKGHGSEKLAFVGPRFSGYELVLPSPFLYQKVFQTQSSERLVYQDQVGLEQVPRLWAYGAQQVGDDIQPFVFALEAVRGQTNIHLSSVLFWRERGVSLFGENSPFQDPFETDQTRTLFESIEAGMSVIHLEMGRDERGQPVMVAYQSYRLSKNTLFYKRQEEK